MYRRFVILYLRLVCIMSFMFNLLVKYDGWEEPYGVMPKDRFLAQTKPKILSELQVAGGYDLEYLASLPALLMPEINSEDAEPYARLAKVFYIEDRGDEYRFEFNFNNTFSPINLRVVERIARVFGTQGFGLRNTHWAVKDENLFRLLYEFDRSPIELGGQVFDVEHGKEELRQVALMMPFKPQFDEVHRAICDLINYHGIGCWRGDNISAHDHVMQDVVNLISASAVVICDITNENPNVFYEMGIAHTLGKKVIIIAQDTSELPFNIRHLRIIRYSCDEWGLKKLQDELDDRLSQVFQDE